MRLDKLKGSKLFWLAACLIFLFLINLIFAQDRFPRPEFDSGYQKPLTQQPAPRSAFLEILDVVLLAATIGLASYFALKKRSRRAIFLLTIFSVVYFGFYRKGCVCAVGSLQNVTTALFNSGFVLPIGVFAFFIIPLIFAILFGRGFCAGVCPLGGVQDLVMLRPVKVPAWLSEVLGVIPYLYLGFTLLFAATGSAFLICRYDPFVSIFRMSNDFGTIVYSAGFVALSVFVARPYCRFLCPYGVLLGWMSKLAKWHVSTTPNFCMQCRLCEDACPMGAIRKPVGGRLPESREQSIRRLVVLFLLLPVIVLSSGWALSRLDLLLSRMHPTVALAEQIQMEDMGLVLQTTLESRTFRSQEKPTQELFDEAKAIRKQFRIGGWFLGGFLGLMFAIKLIRLSVVRPRTDYEIDRVSCYSCSRCFEYCPYERVTYENTQKAALLNIQTNAN
jgi:ferredoxin